MRHDRKQDGILLTSLKTRWNLLLKTAQNDLECLREADFGHDDCLTSSTNSPAALLDGLHTMLQDLQDILKQRQQLSHESLSSHQSTVTPTQVTMEEVDVPPSRLSVFLRDAREAAAAVKLALSSLTSGTPARTHRRLLEDAAIRGAEVARLERQLDGLSHNARDLVTIGTTGETVRCMLDLLARHRDRRADLLALWRNHLVHTLLLARLEAGLCGSTARSAAVPARGGLDALVDRVHDLITEFQTCSTSTNELGNDPSNGEEDAIATTSLARQLATVLTHPALLRLTGLDDRSTRRTGTTTATAKPETKSPPKPSRSPRRRVDRQGRERELEREHWLLTRTWVTAAELAIDSFAVLPPRSGESAGPSAAIGSSEPAIDGAGNSGDDEAAEDPAEDEMAVDGVGEVDLDLPSAPSTTLQALSRHGEDDDDDDDHDGGDGEVDEAEAQRLIQMFGPSPTTSSHDEDSEEDAEEEQEDLSELATLTPAEQEEVLKALASAREHYLATTSVTKDETLKQTVLRGRKSIDDLLVEAEDALREGRKALDQREDESEDVLGLQKGPGDNLDTTTSPHVGDEGGDVD